MLYSTFSMLPRGDQRATSAVFLGHYLTLFYKKGTLSWSGIQQLGEGRWLVSLRDLSD